MCHLSNRLYQTHRDGRWIRGTEEEKERAKEGKTRQKVDWEKQREGQEWRMRCSVSGERQRNRELRKETVNICVYVRESFSREEWVFLKPLRRSVWVGRFFRDDREDWVTLTCVLMSDRMFFHGTSLDVWMKVCEYTSPTSVLVLCTHNICTMKTRHRDVCTACVRTWVAIWRQCLMLNECVCAAAWWTGLTGITHAAAWPLNEPELLCSRVALTGSLQDGCFFKNQINDGYQAYSAIYHEEYYLGRPCMAVTGEPGREEAGWKALDRHSLCDGWLSALSECY